MTSVLKGAQAVKLYAQGREKWNAWVKANPSASVDFTGIKFFKLPEQYKPISFAGYLFPSGDILFDHAEFGDGDVDFENAQFGNGNVSFFKAAFGTGNISFEFCHFGTGELSFESTQFGDGNVIFHCTEFNDGNITFHKASFGKGDISFFGAQFGKSNVDFSACQMEQGDLGFIYTKFGQGDFCFNHVQLTDRNVLFRETQCPDGQFRITKTAFSLHLDLSGLKNESNISHLNLQGSQFKKGLNLSKLQLNNPVNLLQTRLPEGIDIGDLHCDFDTEKVANTGFFSRFQKATHNTASACFARLRELAQQNKDATAESTFYRLERQSTRWHTLNPVQSLLDLAFEWSSDYGRSIRKPVAAILVMAVLNFATVLLISDNNGNCPSAPKAVATSIAMTVPFAGASGLVKQDWLADCISSPGQKDWALLLFSVTGFSSSLMFLLVFLSLFNRYKLKS